MVLSIFKKKKKLSKDTSLTESNRIYGAAPRKQQAKWVPTEQQAVFEILTEILEEVRAINNKIK